MAVSDQDIRAFAEAVSDLFAPWSDHRTITIEHEPEGWKVTVVAPNVDPPVEAEAFGGSLSVVAPGSYAARARPPLWTQMPDTEPLFFQASVPLPAGVDALLVLAEIGANPTTVRVQIPA